MAFMTLITPRIQMATPSNHSTTSFESTTPTLNMPDAGVARQARSAHATKDYAAALGVLQSRYGSPGASVPTPKKDASTKLPQQSQGDGVAAVASGSGSGSLQHGGSQLSGSSSAGFASQVTLATESSDPNQTSASASPRSSSSSLGSGQSKRKIASKLAMLKSVFKGKKREDDTPNDQSSDTGDSQHTSTH